MQDFGGHEDRVYMAGFSPDGEKILTASGDGTARLWNKRTGEPEACVHTCMPPLVASIQSIAVLILVSLGLPVLQVDKCNWL